MFTLRLLGGASLDGRDGPVTGRAALRQRIALLALLAVEHPRPLSRDKLVAYLWPESGTDDARHLLRDSLYILRSGLGDDTVLSTGDDLRLNPDRFACDLWEFEEALAGDDAEAAVGLYHGPFLSGFHLSDAEEFEPWAEGERSRLARRYGQALELVAERKMRDGGPRQAVEWWARLAGEDPYNSRIALRYMQALEAAGDRAGALRHASAHSDLLRIELGAVPEDEVVALAERLRLQSRTASEGKTALAQPGVAVPGSSDEDGADEPSPRTRRQWVLPTALVAVLTLGLGLLSGALSRHNSPDLNARRVAVAVFENRTGRPNLDDLGSMTADWIVRGLMETPLINLTDLETVYAGQIGDTAGRADSRMLARRNGARLVISGNYYRSGDSVLIQARIVDVASGRVLRSFDPVGASVERPTSALVGLRDAIASGLGALVNPANQFFPVDPDLIPPPNYAAYREFIAGLRQGVLRDEAELQHYRRAAELDSTFVAPLVQLAYRATWSDQCDLTDSIATVLDRRRERLTDWDRFTIDHLRARCQGDMATAVALLGQRLDRYPQSLTAKRHYSVALQVSNQPRANRKLLGRLDPELDPEGRLSREELRAAYWWFMAASHHMLGDYLEEVEITDRWRDSSSRSWPIIRGRALGALGREREVLGLLQSLPAGSIGSVAGVGLGMAAELDAHGYPVIAKAVAESVLARLTLAPAADLSLKKPIALANLLLGRPEQERMALEEIVRSDPDSLSMLETQGRIAVLLADTALASRIDSVLAEHSGRPLRTPRVRGAQILARAHIAAGFGRREQAVALLRDASARGMLDLGPSHAFHADPLLAPLRAYPPFEALLRPDN